MDIKTVGVVGAGTMTATVSLMCLPRAGIRCHVAAGRWSNALLIAGVDTIRKNLEREVAKGKLSAEQRDQALSGIKGITDRSTLGGCDFIVEAASERFEIKAELFRDLEKLCRPEVILSSNTSSISITKLASVTNRPDKVIGMHFFNPVPVMKLVEVIRGLATSDETYATVKALTEKLDKTPVEVNDAPGFVSNLSVDDAVVERAPCMGRWRAWRRPKCSGFECFQAGHGAFRRMGPLTLADFIGLDVCLDIMRVLQSGLGDPKYRPCSAADQNGGCGLAGPQNGQRILPILGGTCVRPARLEINDAAVRLDRSSVRFGRLRSGMQNASGNSLVIGGRILVGLYLDLVNHFLHVRNTLGEASWPLSFARPFFTLPFKHQRSVLGVVRDTLVVEILVGLNGRFVVVLDGAIEVRVANRLELALGRPRDATPISVRDGVINRSRSVWQGAAHRLGLLVGRLPRAPLSVITPLSRSCETFTTPRPFWVMALLTASFTSGCSAVRLQPTSKNAVSKPTPRNARKVRCLVKP